MYVNSILCAYVTLKIGFYPPGRDGRVADDALHSRSAVGSGCGADSERFDTLHGVVRTPRGLGLLSCIRIRQGTQDTPGMLQGGRGLGGIIHPYIINSNKNIKIIL